MRADVDEAIEAALEASWFAQARLEAVERVLSGGTDPVPALWTALRTQVCLNEALMRLCRALAERPLPPPERDGSRIQRLN